jgi:uncharacterized membrane protein YeiB
MTGARRQHGFLRCLGLLVGAPVIWMAHFTVIYGGAAVGGALGVAPAALAASAWIATVAASAAIVILLLLARTRRLHMEDDVDRAMLDMAKALGVLSLVAVLLQSIVLTIVPF